MNFASKRNTNLNTNSSTSNSSSRIKTVNLTTPKNKNYNALPVAKENYLLSLLKTPLLLQVLNLCQNLRKKPGIHSTTAMCAGGFHYTDNGDTARCDVCGLEVSGWTLDMQPFTIHAQRSPKCPYVLSIVPEKTISTPKTMNLLTTISTASGGESPSKRPKIELTPEMCQANVLIEVDMLKHVRKRTFSHWPHHTSPSSSQMIEAGFFSCNVGDRVICLYCNLICQQWVPNADNPHEVHKIFSPHCPYVKAMVKRQQAASILIINEYTPNSQSLAGNDGDTFRCNEIVYTAACHTAYIEIPRRHASFATWPDENSPSVDDLVRAGFFYTGTKTIVTCFYCNGSLQNWGANDNPMIEHVRWFPNCAYAKQLCGDEMYRKIQKSKKAQQERSGANGSNEQSGNNNNTLGRGQLNIPDENTLSRFVAARLDLFISQSLLDRNFKLSVIKRCYEDQLRVKHDDFVDDCDVFLAVTILQKQIQHIDGKKENIIVPSVVIKQKEQEAMNAREQATSAASSTNSSSNTTDTDMPTSSEPISNDMDTSTSTVIDEQKNNLKPSTMNTTLQIQTDSSLPSNPCVLCLAEEKRLACIPCGHLATCVPCGHSLRSCPICRREIEAFVRIYI